MRSFFESQHEAGATRRSFESFFAPDARVWWDNVPDSPVQWDRDKVHIGIDAILEGASAYRKAYGNADRVYEITIHECYATGPLVVTKRTDNRKIAGQPDTPFPTFGVFIVEDGLITEWRDYLSTTEAS